MPEVRPNPVEAGGENKSPAGESLLRTKLFVPALRARRVRRSRLIDQLDQAFTHPLTLVSAPAGFGKTTLLVEWILKHNQAKKEADPNLPAPAFCWLSLEESDNDPARFLSYLIAAVESALGHALTGAQSMLHAPQTAPVQSILGVLINELIEIDLPLIVVLDDYHTITQAAIQAGMAFLIDHLPSNMHLILVTRVDPPLPLARWRGRDQLLELRTDDLRFDPEETLEFLRQAMELDLSAEEVAILGNRTEGWITGLQMAAIAIKSPYSKRDPSRFIQEFNGSHRYILEYLVEEVLQRQPEEIQTFLLYTSVLDRLCAPLCEAVMQVDGETRYSLPAAVPILESLDRLNLFIVPLDSERRWFRYHHLFADLLRARLHQAGPDRPPRLHRRASAWFEENGFLDEAIQHAFKAKDFENAARLLEQSVYTSLTHGELATLLARIQAIPEDILRGRASLCVYLSAALIFAGKLDEAESWLEIAEPLIRPGDHELQGNAAIYRALIADLRGEMAAAVHLASQAEQLLPASSLLVRSLIPFILGDGYFGTGDMTGAGQAYEQIHQIGKVTRNPWTISVALAKLASVKKIQGRLHEAMRLYQEVFSMADELGGSTFGTLGASYIGYSDLLREWNELAKARQQVVEAIANMEDWVSPTDLAGAYTLLARLEIEQGNLDQAAAALNKAEQWTGNYQSFRFARSQLEACQARLWLAYPVTKTSTQGISTGSIQGLEAARRWAGEKLAFLKQHAGEAIDLNDEPAWIA
ncbi:MAG: hypothetical protein ACM3PY_15065, partial [Omnitrophica WOR_2 bacterium]